MVIQRTCVSLGNHVRISYDYTSTVCYRGSIKRTIAGPLRQLQLQDCQTPAQPPCPFPSINGADISSNYLYILNNRLRLVSVIPSGQRVSNTLVIAYSCRTRLQIRRIKDIEMQMPYVWVQTISLVRRKESGLYADLHSFKVSVIVR